MVVNGLASHWSHVTNGVPQGSAMGPFLFVIHINDLPAYLDSDAYLHADDTKPCEEITCEADRVKIRSCSLKAEESSNEWLLLYDKSKCHALSIWNEFSSAVYWMATGNTEVEFANTSCEKDIGLLIASKLNFDQHVLSAIKHWIKVYFLYCSRQLLDVM